MSGLYQLFQNAGIIRWPLLLFSIVSLAIIFERLYNLSRIKREEEAAFLALQKSMVSPLDGRNVQQYMSAPVSQVMATLETLRGASEDSISTAADVAIQMQRQRLRKFLGTLATIGSTSPFVGLFGTVLGIIAAFQAMSKSGLNGEAMSLGISESLSATAVGLLVAIPSVIGYNFFTGKVQDMVLQIHGHVARLTPLLHHSAPQVQTTRVKQEV